MKILFLDNETSDVKQEKKRNPSPYLPENFLVSVGWQLYPEETEVTYEFFQHNDAEPATTATKAKLQEALDSADLFVAFNAKFDLAWLLECGFKYEGKIYDPFIVEYILARGQKLDISLEGSCIRRGIQGKKSEKIKELWDQGLTFAEMPLDTVREYGIQDVIALRELFFKQMDLLGVTPEEYGTLLEQSKC